MNTQIMTVGLYSTCGIFKKSGVEGKHLPPCRNRGTAEQNVANDNNGDIHEVASPIRKAPDTPFSSTKTRATIQGQIEDPEVLALDEEASGTADVKA